MPLKTQEMEEPGLNLTPMIDIVMLLVIFFMVGTQFADQESQYEIELPTVSEAQPLTALPDEIVVDVLQDGNIVVDGKVLDTQELESRLRDAKRNYSDQGIIIRGDADGPYQHVMTILNICRRAKISNVQLANQVETEGS